MKKIIALSVLLIMIFSILPVNSFASPSLPRHCPGEHHPNETYELVNPHCSHEATYPTSGTCVFAGHYQPCDVSIYNYYNAFYCSYHYNNELADGTTHYERIRHIDGHGNVVINY